MPLMVLQYPANDELRALRAAITVALGHGNPERTRTLIEGFDAELPGSELEAAERFNRDYGEIIEIDDACFKIAWLTERSHADALTDLRAAIKSDQFQRDKPHNLAAALVARILLEAIQDGTGKSVDKACEEAADQLKRAGRGSEGATQLCYLSSKNTIKKYWSERRGIAHLLLGLVEVEMGNISIVAFPHFCELARKSLSTNRPHRVRAGWVYVPETEQIRIVCGDTGDAPEFTSK